ncbi:MAG: hypothetical protein JXA89_07465, partial [Anaerolineae bacterium]|nr:hypothetical protein [Anaerolineae bacterium]
MISTKKSVGLLATSLLVVLMLGIGADARAQSPSNQVGLVVQFGDGTTLTRCVTFDEPEINGYDVLMRSGLNVVANTSSGIGVAICKIQDQGCPAENCFCTCQGAACSYWSYWHLAGDSWSYAYRGADSYTVRHGDVEGWRWSSEAPPEVISFAQICAPATNTPLPLTGTPPPTSTPLPPAPTPTATPAA